MRLPFLCRPPHPDVAPAPLDSAEPPTAAGWRDGETHVRVSQPAGFLVKVDLHAKVDLPPDDVYSILVSPHNARVFRSISAIPYRRVIAQSPLTIEVDHHARWKLGPLRGTLATKLRTVEDASSRRVTFALREPGFMREFGGEWHVTPFSQAGVDALFGRKRSAFTAVGAALDGALTSLLPGRHTPTSSLVTLTQRVAPAAMPPPPVDRVMARIAARQVKTLLDDLRAEAARRAAGLPSALEGGEGEGGGRQGRRRRQSRLLW